MGAITRAEILAAKDLKRERVDVPDWGDGAYVFVRTLMAWEKDHVDEVAWRRNGASTERNFDNYRALFLTYALVDDSGAQIFAPIEDAKALGEKSSAVLQVLWDAAVRLNRMREQDIQEIVGNSGPGRSGTSPSG